MRETKQGRFNEVIQLSSYGKKGDAALFETNPKELPNSLLFQGQ